MNNNKIIIGRIGEPFGIKGWVHLFSFTDPADNLFQYPNWQIRAYKKEGAQWKPVTLEFHKPHGAAFIAKIKGINTPEQALQLKNHTIAVERSDLPALPKNEYYWSDLIGLSIINTKGESLGVIDYLFETGANDIIATKGEKTHYIPYLKDVVKSIDLEKKIMIVEWDALE